jgi:hypothetical protein
MQMTARTQLDRLLRWMRGAIYFGLGLFFLGILLGAILDEQEVLIPAISLPGFAIAFVANMVGYFGALRCPRCRGNLGPLLMPQERRWFSVVHSVCFCPYCGSSLDEELPQEGAAER